MSDNQTPNIDNFRDTGISKIRGSEFKRGIFPKGLVSIFVESVLAGFALFSASIIQKTYFDLQEYQFLIGEGELVRMSLGIAFCYSFVSVLRRVYKFGNDVPRKVAAKRISGLVAETYIFFLALLFVAKDINFNSTKLALGIGFLLNVAFIFLYRFVFVSRKFRAKESPIRRKIILKKPAHSVIVDESNKSIRGHSKNPHTAIRFDNRMDKIRDDEDSEDSSGNSRHRSNSEYSDEPSLMDSQFGKEK